MENPVSRGPVDSGVDFFRFCWEELKPELERLDQADLDGITVMVLRHADRKHPDLSRKVKEGIKLMHEAAKPRKTSSRSKVEKVEEPPDPRDDKNDRWAAAI